MALTALGTALLRRFDPETAHRMALLALKVAPLPTPPADDPVLATTVGRLRLSNPVGLAAGFDKDGEALRSLARLGFGFVECGSVTPRPQPGNPKPRLFRLDEDQAVINRMGFNNRGLEAFADRLGRRPRGTVIGANLGANKATDDKAADYVAGLRRLRGLADYVTVNVSSPNTPGLRDLQGRAALDDLLGRLAEARSDDPTPVFLKIAPDLTPDDLAQIAEVALASGISGIIATNTMLSREGLKSASRGEAGGLSGAPLFEKSTRVLAQLSQLTHGLLPLIGVGGISSAEQAYQKIRAGASAVQLYTAMVYRGISLIPEVARGLDALLARDGFATVAMAVGTDRSAWL